MKKIFAIEKKHSKDIPFSAVLATPFGKIGIKTIDEDGHQNLYEINYLSESQVLIAPQNTLSKEVIKQIKAYLKDPEFQFEVPLSIQGTFYQRKVWEQISKIPTGQTITYGSIAKIIRSGPRAIGGACGANPFPLIIPCHRVVSAAGLGGFVKENKQGYYRDIKGWLLRHEKALV
ncbi:MAG: methylated-DNA--[protein]-cysteine S-methyltransferase [Betaproteobacteria bacterium]|jgi:methylated-DNA-[protein]-cysteine S-methyltransferase